MTYAPAKFEAAMANGFGGNASTRNICLILTQPKVNVTWSIALYYIMWHMNLQSLKVLRPMVKDIHYKKKHIIWPWTQGQRVKVTQNVAKYPRLHVTYAPAKVDIATSHG